MDIEQQIQPPKSQGICQDTNSKRMTISAPGKTVSVSLGPDEDFGLQPRNTVPYHLLAYGLGAYAFSNQ